ncbi:hypothetical protein [Arthrobacter sp. H5]|uniref:hypothetical protein n=1 Tax=Arthrobacter sp. H5 TaxID=1267973 RepID=UPI0004805FCE|nr:hypothetical protein [Arthrobacter sp. H5]
MRTQHLLAAVCVALVLTGCTGGPEEDPDPDVAKSSAPAPATTPEPSEEPAADSGIDAEYAPDQLEAALTAVNEAEALEGVIATDAQLRPILEAAGDNPLSGIVITPEECNVLRDANFSNQVDSANLAVMSFAGGSSLQPDSLSLASQAESESVQAQLEASRDQLAECGEYQLENSGEVITAEVTEVEAATDAEDTFAIRTVVLATDTTQESLSVTGILGATTINVIVGSSGDPEADLDRAVGLVNAAIAELQGA